MKSSELTVLIAYNSNKRQFFLNVKYFKNVTNFEQILLRFKLIDFLFNLLNKKLGILRTLFYHLSI